MIHQSTMYNRKRVFIIIIKHAPPLNGLSLFVDDISLRLYGHAHFSQANQFSTDDMKSCPTFIISQRGSLRNTSDYRMQTD